MDSRRVLIFLTILTVSASLLIVLMAKLELLLPFLLGAVLATLNLAGTAFAWPRILEKKSIALSVGIIVSKFAITIGAMYWLMKPSAFDVLNDWFFKTYLVPTGIVSREPSSVGMLSLIAFIAGVAMVLPAVVSAHFTQERDTGNESRSPS